MVSKKSQPTGVPISAEETSVKLRELRARATEALTAQRERLERIESELTLRVAQLAESYETSLAVLDEQRRSFVENAPQDNSAALAALRDELHTAHDASQAEQGRLAEDLALRERALTEAQEENATLKAQLDAEAEQNARLEAAECQRVAELEQFQEQLAVARSALESLRDRPCDACSNRESEISESERRREEAAAEASSLQQALAGLQAEIGERNAAWEQLQGEQERLAGEQQSVLADLSRGDAERALLEAERDRLLSEVAIAQADVEAARCQASAAAVQAQQEVIEVERLRESAAQETSALQQECASLRQELALLMSTEEMSTEQFGSLQKERDALAQCVAELERSQGEAASAEHNAQLDDLQGLLDEADEAIGRLQSDVERLQRENAALRERPARSAPSLPAGPLNWESQKKQLLAMLDDEAREGAPGDPGRQEERASISETLAITDRALAEKEARIAELQAALELQRSMAAVEEQSDQSDALLDADDVVQQERLRLQELTAQWQSKLGAAELELSVERAKLARERSALNELREQLDTKRPEGGEKSRRGWRTALGLHDD